MADGQGSFVTRSFERLLKDSAGRRYPKLQGALKAYLDRPRDDVFKNIVLDDRPSGTVESDAAPGGELVPEVLKDTSVPDQDADEDAAAPLPATRTPEEAALASLATMPASEFGPLPPSAPVESNVAAAATMATAGHSLTGPAADLVVLPLQLAIETKQSRLIETALDCLHKLIAYGHLEGEAGLEGGRNSRMMTELFQLVCNCSDITAVDSVVLQVIKVILTCVASSSCQVHGECLVLGLRTCYNIVLNSKNSVNLMTAKGTLTQMISIVFKRMELAGMQGHGSPTTLVPDGAEDAGGYASANGGASLENNHADSAEASGAAAVSVEEIQALGGMSDIKGLEAALDQAVKPGGAGPDAQGLDLDSMGLWQRDALLVFRTLCKMAMKEGTDDLLIRTKVLSLELLLGLLESVSPSFTMNFVFIDSIKMYLCYALVRAHVSTLDKVFQLSCSIFAVLITRFRESLKAEIGLFFPLVVLRSLDSAESPLSHRTAVLKMLEEISARPQLLADVFVNYDCDLEATNLFERMANSLSRIAQGTPGGDPNSIAVAQNTTLKATALQCLVNVLQSLVKWSGKDLPSEETGPSSSEDSASVASDGAAEPKVPKAATEFEKAKAHKATMEAAVAQFNMKPEKGIAFLEANKLAPKEPAAIANFLRTTPGIDKVLAGDYLGQHDDFHVAVMHAYVDSMDFKGLKFDRAIREFLKGFRLPGEAQKIDRIMEKFAERYCLDNPGLFKSADTAYVLAYAVIMLNTDAHNENVTNKMAKADFIRLNQGVEGEEPAPAAMLEEIYDSIVNDEIKLKDDPAAGGKGKRRGGAGEKGGGNLLGVLNLAAPKRKTATGDTKLESEEIVLRTQALFKSGGMKRGVFYTAWQAELARPMLEAVGWPLLAAFSVTMEEGDIRTRVGACMDGFRLGILLTKYLGMETMRYAFLTSLVRFTFLHQPMGMRSKNVDALRLLLMLADQEPDALQDTWNAVLECLSRLEHITSTPSLSAQVMLTNSPASRDALVASLVELADKPSDQVFAKSAELPSDTAVEFFVALCGVSAQELRNVPPRVFSLQKLVEISYYNMSRIRMVWARIWTVLSAHFVSAGNHPDHKVAMYAIDSLRQLAMKYLERAELAQFTFQNEIMKPFVVIMRTCKNASTRELVVQCIVQMIQSKVGSIKSGWRSVFMVLTTAASDMVESIVETAFENAEQVVLEHFDQVVGDCFMDCVNCLIAFANNKVSPRISLKSIALLRICEDRLAEGRIPGGALRSVHDSDKVDDREVAEYYWFPMLAGLSDLTSDPRTEVRNCALEVLFDLLKERGEKFSALFWESIFERVLFPIFDYVRHAGTDGQKPASADLWLRETSIHCLHLLCDLFCSFYRAVSFMLPSLLGLLLDCATRPDQGLAAISIGALLRLMEAGSELFSDRDWTVLLDSIREATTSTRADELLGSADESGLTKSRRNVLTKVQILTGPEAARLVDTPETPPRHEPPRPAPPHEGGGDDFGRTSMEGGATLRGEGGEGEQGTEQGGAAVQGNGGEVQALGGEESIRLELTGGPLGGEPPDHFQEGAPEEAASGPAPSPAANAQASLFAGTYGKTLMGSMLDTLLMKNLTLRVQTRPADAPLLAAPPPVVDAEEVRSNADDEDVCQPLDAVRTKCYVQLLLLSALDQLQAKHWDQLGASHKRQLLDNALSMVEFAAEYNRDAKLQQRMQQFSSDRPPPSLLRQEVSGAQLYLTALYKAIGEPVAPTPTAPLNVNDPPYGSFSLKPPAPNGAARSQAQGADGVPATNEGGPRAERKEEAEEERILREEAEDRLLHFCERVLMDAAALQPGAGEGVPAEVYRSLALRAPVVAKVLRALSRLESTTFERFADRLYPHCTRLICSDQMEVRRALGELFRARLIPMLQS